MDGANPWQKFRGITIPMLLPVIVASVILRIIGLVNSPDLMIVLTNGGPGLTTYVISLHAFTPPTRASTSARRRPSRS